MTLAKYEASLQGSNLSHKMNVSALPSSKFHQENRSSVVKIGLVKVRFTRKFSKNDYSTNCTSTSLVQRCREASKHIDNDENDHVDEAVDQLGDEEDNNLKCCGVLWPSSRIPLATSYSNYRHSNRRICADGCSSGRSSSNSASNDTRRIGSFSHRRNDDEEQPLQQRRNYFTAAATPPSSVLVRRCPLVWSQLRDVRAVRPTLVCYCFGEGAKGDTSTGVATCKLCEFCIATTAANANHNAVSAARCDPSPCWCCDRKCSEVSAIGANYASVDQENEAQLDTPKRCIEHLTPNNRRYGCDPGCRRLTENRVHQKLDSNLASRFFEQNSDCSNYSTTVKGDTLDRFQKFGFGGDKKGRNGGGRRGSGSSHKKKTAPTRSSDKTINLKKLTDKLKQTTTSSQLHEEEDDGGSSTKSSNVYCAPPSPPPLPPYCVKPSPPPLPAQILIPLKGDVVKSREDDTDPSATSEKNTDLFDSVNLKLTKPESRTIVGSYYQRSIPFRSASFSQVHYLPDDRKYIRNSLRKPGSLKRAAGGTVTENVAATLPRVNTSMTSIMEPDSEVQPSMGQDIAPQYFCTFTGEPELLNVSPSQQGINDVILDEPKLAENIVTEQANGEVSIGKSVKDDILLSIEVSAANTIHDDFTTTSSGNVPKDFPDNVLHERTEEMKLSTPLVSSQPSSPPAESAQPLALTVIPFQQSDCTGNQSPQLIMSETFPMQLIPTHSLTPTPDTPIQLEYTTALPIHSSQSTTSSQLPSAPSPPLHPTSLTSPSTLPMSATSPLLQSSPSPPPSSLPTISCQRQPNLDASDEYVSLIEMESAEPLTSSVIPIIAPVIPDKNKYPQPPKRTKYKHKPRHRPSGRLYFSDENIFLSGAAADVNDCTTDRHSRVESVENISVTIHTPEDNDNVVHKGETEPTILQINFINDTNDQPQTVQNSYTITPSSRTEEDASMRAKVEVKVGEEIPVSKSKEIVDENGTARPSAQPSPPPLPPKPSNREKLVVDMSAAAARSVTVDVDPTHFSQTPSSPEDAVSLRPQWPLIAPYHARNRLTPQTSTEKEDEPELYTSRKFHLFCRGDSFSEADSDPGDKRSVSPAASKDGRLSPLPYSSHEMSDSDSRSTTPRSAKHFAASSTSSSSVPYSKRPLRGPYLEMIVNEQKKPENLKNTSSSLNKLLRENRAGWILGGGAGCSDRAVDDYYLRRSNTSPNSSSQKLNAAGSSSLVASASASPSPASLLLQPKRKISANIPFCAGPNSLCAPVEEKTLVHHQRTTSSPSQLEYYPDQLGGHSHHEPVPNQQLLHQLLRGSSEQSLIQDVDLMKKMYPVPTYKDTRSHIVVELYDTERSYVESLQILVTKYLQPLKSPECSNLIDTYVVEEIFYKIPEILAYHEIFLEELRIRLEGWNKSKCIGDIFLETFTKPAVIDSYIAFINNRKTANESIKQITQTKPAFVRFIDAMAREHKGKLTLDSLLIMPVQRIPRYELLIQSMLKHTEICHPDYDKLQEALRQIHELALRINCTERDSLELEQIENLIDGLANLVTGDRTFLRYDLVTMTSGQGPSRKERALFLFNDLLIITSVKRRSSTVKKPVLSSPASITSSLESNKYKLLMKIPLEHLDIVKVKDENLRRMMREMEYLTDDVNTLSQMVDLVATLHCPHGQIEENIREMLSALNKQLNDRHVSESQLSYLELALNTRNSVENISVIFPKPEKRTNWEETFLEAKTRLNVSGDRRLNPEFLTSVPIRKTRAGLQFTCAAASYNQQDVWVCNSDGYVGQVCILSLNPEPAVTSCNGVCNARILSVTSVPVSRYIEKCEDGSDNLSSLTNVSSAPNLLPKSEPFEEVNESIPLENLERDVSDICLDSSSSSDEEDDDEPVEEQKPIENTSLENVDSTMWLGTEDGVVHIYNCADSLRIKRNRLKIQHNSAVYCIFYVEKSVFVSLANGEVYMYNWCASFGWNTTDPIVILVGCVTSPVSRMFLVCGKLWCVCHNIIKTLNIHTLQIENSFTIIGENNRAITSVAVSGYSVYLSLQNSAVLRVVHGLSCEILTEVNIAPAVTKMLSGVDDIIRQHKAACLRVTSLLACKELLWIGTSAGVILTMPLPAVKQDTAKVINIPHPVGLPHGHTGHVRFLTAVKYKGKKKDTTARRSSKVLDRKPDLSNVNKMLIISGGDGYEDFRSSSVSEIAGREDSTNHLLIWRF